jgi:hypothetical protein
MFLLTVVVESAAVVPDVGVVCEAFELVEDTVGLMMPSLTEGRENP